MDHGVLVAFALTLLAGLATGLGGVLVLLVPRDPRRLLAASLGFSAGVMVWISFLDLYPEAQALLAAGGHGPAVPAALFFGGMVLTAGIDFVVPEQHNPHLHGVMDSSQQGELSRMGLFTALAVGLHNFPEGIATFVGALHDPVVGGTLALAVGLHNLPEGIAVAMPVYKATGSRWKGIRAAMLSGLAEPAGALLAWLVLGPVLTESFLGGLFAVVAGVMVFLSLDQLLPNAKRYSAGHASVYGLVLGMGLMALTLVWR